MHLVRFRRARIDPQKERLLFQLAQPRRIELAHETARRIEDQQARHRIANSSFHTADRALDGAHHLARREPDGGDRGDVDQSPLRGHVVKFRRMPSQVLIEIHLEKSLSRQPELLFVLKVPPRVHTRVFERAAVVRVVGHSSLDVVMSQRDVGPAIRMQLRTRQVKGLALMALLEHVVQVAVQHQYPVARGSRRSQRWQCSRAIGHCEYLEIELRKSQGLRSIEDDGEPQLPEQAENAPGLGRSRLIVVSADHHDERLGQRVAKARKLTEGVNDDRICRPDHVEYVAGNEDHVRLERNDLIQRAHERPRHVGLALIEPARGEPMVLTVAEVQVGEMYQAHDGIYRPKRGPGEGATISAGRSSACAGSCAVGTATARSEVTRAKGAT